MKHVSTPLYHPWSNELAEKFIDEFKRAFGKTGNKSLVDNTRPAHPNMQTFYPEIQ